MTHDRAAFITAYRALHGGTDTEADRILRGVEQAYAAKENAELLDALDKADGEHVREISEYRKTIDVLNRILETFPDSHARFGVINPDGTSEILPCADWCHACKIDELKELRKENAELRQQLNPHS